MTKQRRNTVILVAAVLLLAVVGMIIAKNMSKGNRIIVTMNGQVIKDLPYGTEERLTITNPETGLTNVLVCTPDGVYMESAECPDKVCVHTGTIHPGDIIPIACLPNKLVIEITE